MAAGLPEPSRTYMQYVNDRDVSKLGAVLAPHLDQAGVNDPALSPELAPPPAAADLPAARPRRQHHSARGERAPGQLICDRKGSARRSC